MRVIGAGLPRTGTTSLKAGLERLLDGRCYHMFELIGRAEDDGPKWFRALLGESELLTELLADWDAAVDWPASILWRELIEQHPDATVVLSHRGDAQTWWKSVDATVWATMRQPKEPPMAMFNEVMRNASGFGDEWDDPAAAMARYDAHFDEVVAAVPAERLVIWQPSDGWGPLCAALGVPVPDEPFGHHNPRAEFRERAGLDDSAD